MVSLTIFAGGYDVFIAAYLFNTVTSSLTLAGKYPSGANPSWVTLHPSNKSILYATNENAGGALQSFEIAGSVLSRAVDTVPSDGDSPAFAAALSTGEVAILNYSSGNGRIIPTTTSPAEFSDNAPVISFPPQAASGGVSHPHMALQHGNEIFVSDLGGDMIWRITRTGGPGVYSITGSIPQPIGSGPRHIAISHNRLYTLHELASTLTVQEIPSAPNGTSKIISTASIIPSNPPASAQWAAAEILIPPPSPRFSKQYIYVSNRNTGVQTPTGDSIAIFENLDQGTPKERLHLVTQVFTGLDQIRGMEFGGEDDEYLIAGGVAGAAGVVIYRRVDEGRGLAEVVRNTDIPTRTSFVWV
ncbi:Lactonase, 7-bladed beta-propeller-domain-containing protein [Mycena belliarum]|uniref:Lactonase, 7-bladed beta-propeller-domain-containing protein n=1 Tax=Mycena belliarum TaxID=1033014 RepID=A0AAD6UGK4_9AGAR|nr:Lactonase, 7-bladed beta-propeller-domain-containing protein [Mycena belliae]